MISLELEGKTVEFIIESQRELCEARIKISIQNAQIKKLESKMLLLNSECCDLKKKLDELQGIEHE